LLHPLHPVSEAVEFNLTQAQGWYSDFEAGIKSQTNSEKKKTTTEELWEEVVEEILDTVNPEEDD